MSKVLNSVTAILAFLIFTSQANAFGMPKVPGVGDDKKSESSAAIDWNELASIGDDAIVDIVLGSKLLSESLATIAEALDLQDQAATLRSQANGIDSSGTQSSSSSLKEIQAQNENVSKLVLDKLSVVESLSEAQKEQVTKGLQQYVLGGVRYVKGLKSGKDVFEKSSDAPMMKKRKFVDVVKVVPTALGGAKGLLGTAPKLIQLAIAKGAKQPEAKFPEMADFG